MRRLTIILLLIPLFILGFYQYCIKKVGSTVRHVDHGQSNIAGHRAIIT